MQKATIIGAILVVILMVSACSNTSKKEQLKDFEYEQDFETNKVLFNKDTFALDGHSTEGGEILAFQSSKKPYKVYDTWLYGEMSKQNTTYFIDKSNTIRLVKQTTYRYDKPIYLEGATAKELVQYFTYNKGDFRYFSNIKLEITYKELKTKKRKELEQLFKTVLQSSKNGGPKKK